MQIVHVHVLVGNTCVSDDHFLVVPICPVDYPTYPELKKAVKTLFFPRCWSVVITNPFPIMEPSDLHYSVVIVLSTSIGCPLPSLSLFSPSLFPNRLLLAALTLFCSHAAQHT